MCDHRDGKLAKQILAKGIRDQQTMATGCLLIPTNVGMILENTDAKEYINTIIEDEDANPNAAKYKLNLAAAIHNYAREEISDDQALIFSNFFNSGH